MNHELQTDFLQAIQEQHNQESKERFFKQQEIAAQHCLQAALAYRAFSGHLPDSARYIIERRKDHHRNESYIELRDGQLCCLAKENLFEDVFSSFDHPETHAQLTTKGDLASTIGAKRVKRDDVQGEWISLQFRYDGIDNNLPWQRYSIMLNWITRVTFLLPLIMGFVYNANDNIKDFSLPLALGVVCSTILYYWFSKSGDFLKHQYLGVAHTNALQTIRHTGKEKNLPTLKKRHSPTWLGIVSGVLMIIGMALPAVAIIGMTMLQVYLVSEAQRMAYQSGTRLQEGKFVQEKKSAESMPALPSSDLEAQLSFYRPLIRKLQVMAERHPAEASQGTYNEYCIRACYHTHWPQTLELINSAAPIGSPQWHALIKESLTKLIQIARQAEEKNVRKPNELQAQISFFEELKRTIGENQT